ncbi:MAG TPA: hypothetical protein VEI82_00935 [Myxococcota bacterium]|nr:hypothetical protein [Myxococcota bacterium]
MGWLRSWRDYRALAKLPADWRRIVFYAESGQDWHHMAPIVARLVELGRRVSYATSDAADPAFAQQGEHLRCFHVAEGWPRILWFQTLRADVLVLTVMDLGNLELKRSAHPVHYVYVFHSLGSTHMVDLPGAFDHYDTILCAGPHQLREIRRREELAGLPPKELLPHGYARLEGLMQQAAARPHLRLQPATLLVAPTWGPQNLLAVCGERLVEILLDAGFRVIVRPHYQMLRQAPEIVARLRARFAGRDGFEYLDSMGETESLFRSDLLISDWSAMSVEYALGLEKPVLFIDVPPRVRNPDWPKFGLEPLEIGIRERAGSVLDPARLEQAPQRIAALLAEPGAFRSRIAALREEVVFNPGSSALHAAREIARIADERRAAGGAGRG